MITIWFLSFHLPVHNSSLLFFPFPCCKVFSLPRFSRPIAERTAPPVKAEEKRSWAVMESNEEKEMATPNADSSGSGDHQLDDPEYSDIKAVTFGDTVYTSAVAFEDLKLSHEIIKGLYVEMGFSKPSKIQALTVPMIITPPYKDLVAQAHNGSGKTTCFELGMLSRVDPTRKEMRRWSWPIEKEGGRLLEDPTIWLWRIEKEAAQACDNAGGRLLPDNSNIESVTYFEDLNLPREIIDGLYVEMHFSTPTKIQTLTLPMIVTPPYKDLVAQAHNGSGKTTCSVLGVLSRVGPTRKVPQAICICPTRELALQSHEVLLKMGKYTGKTSMCAIPSDSANYIPINKRPPVTGQVIIGTPGTIKKWTSAKKLSTRDIKILVFDEADQMLAEGQELVIGNVGYSRAILGTRDQDNSLIAVQMTVQKVDVQVQSISAKYKA